MTFVRFVGTEDEDDDDDAIETVVVDISGLAIFFDSAGVSELLDALVASCMVATVAAAVGGDREEAEDAEQSL